MGNPWYQSVEAYVDRLEEQADAIDQLLQTSQVDTSRVNAAEVENSIAELTERLKTLEELVAQRESLLTLD